jgi:hypothetical protein
MEIMVKLVFGFFGCLVLILVAKSLLAPLLQQKEDSSKSTGDNLYYFRNPSTDLELKEDSYTLAGGKS